MPRGKKFFNAFYDKIKGKRHAGTDSDSKLPTASIPYVLNRHRDGTGEINADNAGRRLLVSERNERAKSLTV